MKTFVKAMLLCAAFCPFFSCSPDDGTGENTGELPNVNYASEEGLYVGVIGFNNTTVSKEISILNKDTKYYFTSFISNLRSANGTALYYSVDKAIDNLTHATLPAELENVSIVTFTDGLDNFSTVMPDVLEYDYTKKQYLTKVNEKLTTTTIRNKTVTAYSIGILGDDVQDEDEFKNNLKSLSTSEESIYQVENMADVNRAFEQIAKSLNTKSVSKSITLKISGGVDNGSRIRFTLDNVSDASVSDFYIEGDIYRSNKTFSNVTCKGLSIDANNIEVSIVDGFIVLLFNKVETDNEIKSELIKYWAKNSKGEWQKDSEFDPTSQAETSIIRKSAAIMLVLDCSSSLGNDFEQLKTTAKDFINILVSGESNTSGGSTNSGNNNNNGGNSDARRVDLGLSVCWASCNVGANSPEEYGDYYAWGDTEEMTYYGWTSYKWGDNYTTLTKYCTDSSFSYDGAVDNKTILEPEDDVAHVKWGDSWRMPTSEEVQELISHCNWERTTLNNVNGWRVMGGNGNEIFIPAAGYYHYGEIYDSGLFGYYWSASLYWSYNPDAFHLYFSYYQDITYGLRTDLRIYGFPVRPVTE